MNGLTYIPNFITGEEEQNLLQFLHEQQWDSSEIKRETQHFGKKYSYNKKNTEIEVPPIPIAFNFLLEKLEKITNRKFDQAIVNRYKPGEGIGPHIDDTNIYDDIVVSISLMSTIPMIFTTFKKTLTQNLERYSAIILEKDARYKWKHQIKSVKKDDGILRKERISITFRILKKSNKKAKLV
jgi:alkylated DNA repair dioxygenase AlkB